MRPYALRYFYRRRLRSQAAQELFAGFGIAVAVALVFAALVANGSVVGSATQVVRAVVGPANLQLRARGADGFDEHLLGRVERLRGVKQAAPLLEQTATIIGPRARRVTVDVAGADIGLATLNGLAHTLPIAALSPGGIGLSQTSAKELGIARSGAATRKVTLVLRGRAIPLKVGAVLGAETFGALSRALVAVMPLTQLQRLAQLRGRITRVLVQTQPGQDALVGTELRALGGGRLTVAPAKQDVALLRQALRPSDQASELFAAIGALIGFLLAFNAMLLTVPERRQVIADLRLDGTPRVAIVQMVLFQALCLGLAASLVGLLGGFVLSVGVFHQSPSYLSRAFTLGTSTVVGVAPVLLALGGGLLATCVASMIPLLDLRRGRAVDSVNYETGVPGNSLGGGTQRPLLVLVVGLFALAGILFAFVPSAALISCVVLTLATVLAVPLALRGVLRISGLLVLRTESTLLPLAVMSLRARTLSSLALAATGAVALFGSVALGGARSDLLRGIEGYIHGYVSDASIWVVNPRDPTAVEALPSGYAARIASIPGVSGVRAFQDSYLDLGNRRIWVVARPPGASRDVLKDQVVDGDTTAAAAHIDAGGWIAVSKQIANEHHLAVGDTLSLPAPAGNVALKIAATTTNLTWSPGAILIGTADYARAWDTTAPTALGVNVAPATNVSRVRAAITRALGPTSGAEALTPDDRATKTAAVGREGLSQLGEIAMLLVLAAILAMAAALGSSIWQQRPSAADLRIDGTKPRRLRGVLLIESLMMLGAGCLPGAIAGIYGQIVIDGYLRHVTGFPVAGVAAGWRPLEISLLVIAAVLAIVAVPGWLASRVSPALALEQG
jgi:putative ABC transport system permease protein